MADNPPAAPKKSEEDKLREAIDKEFKITDDSAFFKTGIPGLEIVVGDPDPTRGEVAHPVVRFVPFFEEQRGVAGEVKVGYLATDDGSALKKLRSDPNVTEIDEQEFYDSVIPRTDKSGKQYAGVRAPY